MDNIYVSSGVVLTSIKANTNHSNHYLYVLDGGVIESLRPFGTEIWVSSGGVANNTNLGTMYVCSGGIANNSILRVGWLTVLSGGIANNTNIISSGWLNLYSSSTANNTTVGCVFSIDEISNRILTSAAGSLFVGPESTANGVTVTSGGSVYVSSGGRITGKMTFEQGAIVSMVEGAVLDFDLTQAKAGSAALVTTLSVIRGAPIYTLTVSDSQKKGKYTLVESLNTASLGNTIYVSFFNSSVSIVNKDGNKLGDLKVGETLRCGSRDYTLNLEGISLSVTVGMPDLTPPTITNIKTSITTPTNQAVTVTAKFADDVKLSSSFYRVGEDGEWLSYTNGVTVTQNTTVFFKAVDTSGNESKIVSYTVTNIDKDPPAKPTPSADTTAPTKRRVLVSADFSEDSVKKECSTDGETWAKYTTAVKLTENGMVYFRSTDAVGNVSDIASYSVTNIDKSLSDDGPDDGWNNYLYDKKNGLNPKTDSFSSTTLDAGLSGNILLDKEGSVDVDGKCNFVGRYEDDFIDVADYAKIELTTAANWVFTINSTDAVKFTVCKLNETIDKKGKVSHSLKTLQTTTFTLKKGETSVEANTKGLLLEAGEYYLSVQSTNYKKGDAAFYNVNLNETGDKPSYFYTDDDNGDNNYLYDKKQKDVWNSNVLDANAVVIDDSFLEGGNSAIQIDTDAETEVKHNGFTNFVGFGDAMDFRKIELKSAAKLSFDLAKTTGGAAKLIVYTVNDSGKMVVANSKLTVTAKATATTGILKNQVVLQKGVYYIAVQSTDAKKGKETYYNVSLNANSVFYEHGDLGKNDFNSKTQKVDADVMKDENAVALHDGNKLRLDGVLNGDTEINETKSGIEYLNFVGTGDTSDVARINTVAGMKLSLKVTATDAVNLVIYGLQKNGTLKALKTIKSKSNVAELVDFELKAKSAPGGQFFLGVTSTNAKKGSHAYYNVDVVSVSEASAAPLSTSEASALAMPETSDELAMTDELGFGGYDTDVLASAGAFFDATTERIFEESGKGMLARL